MAKLRLLHVLVQPVFVLDHGDHLEEIDHPPVTVPANEWPTYSNERFPKEVAAWQAQIDDVSGAAKAVAKTNSQPKK